MSSGLTPRPSTSSRRAPASDEDPDASDADEDEDEDEEEEEDACSRSASSRRRAPLKAPDDWQGLLRWAAGELGLRLGAYWSLKGVLRQRLQERMAAVGCADLLAYQRLLEDPEEMHVLQTSVLQIDISRFFRTGSLWQFLLASVLPQLQEACAAKGEPCRCWVMGAGLGEEVYSLRACWELGFVGAAGERPPPLEIVVSEISQDGVAYGKAGDYVITAGNLRKSRQGAWAAWDSSGAETFREVPKEWLEAMFAPMPNGKMRITKRLRKGISWRCESWDAPLEDGSWLEEVGGPFHLILGRHGPFFYPSTAVQKRLVAYAASALRSDGYLIVGRDESKGFTKTVAPAAPQLQRVERPPCVCGRRLPGLHFKASRKAKAVPAGSCQVCFPVAGNPGRMVWRKA